MPGAAEYEGLLANEFKEFNFEGEATGMMSAQSISHLVIVLFIIFGNIAYYFSRKRN